MSETITIKPIPLWYKATVGWPVLPNVRVAARAIPKEDPQNSYIMGNMQDAIHIFDYYFEIFDSDNKSNIPDSLLNHFSDNLRESLSIDNTRGTDAINISIVSMNKCRIVY